MCLIIKKPSGRILDESIYKNGWDNNEDGAGFAYVNEDNLIIDKGFMNYEAFIQAIRLVEDAELIVHFRRASQGLIINDENTHPFWADTKGYVSVPVVGEDGKQAEDKDGPVIRPRFQFAIMHNGKLPWRDTKSHSDTRCFVDDMLAPTLNQNPYFLDHWWGTTWVSKLIGESNKIAVMRYDCLANKSDIYIIHEHKGHIHDKCWFSNYSYAYPFLKNRPQYLERELRDTGKAWQAAVMNHLHGHQSGFGYDPEFDGPIYGNKLNGVIVSGTIPSAVYEMGHQPSFAYSEVNKEFIIPDAHGWFWTFNLDCWINKNTGTQADVLGVRPKRPPYMAMRTNFKAATIHLDGATDTLPEKLDKAALQVKAITGPSEDNEIDPDTELSYMTKHEKKILRKLGAEYLKGVIPAVKDRSGFTNNDSLKLMRDDIRIAFDDQFSDAPDGIIDNWVLQEHINGRDVVLHLLNRYDKALTEEMAGQKAAINGTGPDGKL